MNPKLIVMLTHRDQTVKDALQVFDQCKDMPVQNWGFKDVGLPPEQMKKLVSNIKAAGKTSYLEVVTYTEKECLDAARLALECEFDYLMGTVFFPSVFQLMKGKATKYCPFIGKVSGSPSILEGTVDEIIRQARELAAVGVEGFNLLALRHVSSGEQVAREVIKQLEQPVIMAGSISSYDRVDFVKEINPWAFTIGGAFFEGKFLKDGSFRDQVAACAGYLAR